MTGDERMINMSMEVHMFGVTLEGCYERGSS